MNPVYTAYASRGKTAWWRYLVAIPLALVLFVVAAVIIIVPLMMTHALPPNDELLHPTKPVVFFASAGLQFGALLAGFVAAIRWAHDKRPGDVTGPWSWRLVGLGAAAWLVVEVAGALVQLAVAPHAFTISIAGGTGALALSAMIGLAVQTFAEEFVFRGYLTQALWLATRRPWVTAVLSGLLFGVLHIPNGWPQAANAMVFGMATAVIAMRTGGIAFTFGLHYLNNVFAAVVVVSAADVFRGSPGLLTENAPRLMGLDLATTLLALLALLWLTSARSRLGARLLGT